MGNRRLALVASDDEDDAPPPPPSSRSPKMQREQRRQKLRKVKLNDEDEDEEGEEEEVEARAKKKARKAEASPSEEEEEEEENEEEIVAEPIGEPVRFSGKGRGRRKHFQAFELEGVRYDLEDPVLLVPEESAKPYVAIIKDITQTSQTKVGSLMVTGQWFYRPEEAEKKGGGNWQSRDTRELFYSFHRDQVPAESVMHKCVVHFIPLNKQVPQRKQHPGFFVRKVYDTEQRILFKLTDKDYEDNKQHEIDLLVQKTMSRLGDLPDIVTGDSAADQEDQLRNKRLLRRKSMPPLDVTREEEETTKSGQSLRVETPGSCNSNTSEYHSILANFKALTGETQRDKWLEKLLQGVQFICSSLDSGQTNCKEKGGSDDVKLQSSKAANGSKEQSQNDTASFPWPAAAVLAVVSLEKASHEALSSDFQKYNQKMRQLVFNLKSNAQLARRLLNGELEPSKILNMSPTELKEGLTKEELASREPEESVHMQMTDARCKRCMEKKVGLIDIIQAGHGSRYQLQCVACGNTWYSSSSEAATLTIDGPSSVRSVGTAPWATAKFEDIEKLASPRETEKSAVDILKKTTEPYKPVLENQKSFAKPRGEENTAVTTTAE